MYTINFDNFNLQSVIALSYFVTINESVACTERGEGAWSGAFNRSLYGDGYLIQRLVLKDIYGWGGGGGSNQGVSWELT